jgi:spermidine/putrescine transport system ATP-binding protein
MLSLQSITKQFGTTQAVSNISLEIPAGSLFFLLGASGSGKSTLLRIISGLEKQTSGHIYLNGNCIDSIPVESRNIGFVFQNYALWPHFTVENHIYFGLRLTRLSRSEQTKRFKKVVALSQLDPFLQRYPHQLSGGQQQRVAVARALALEPAVLLLDEPLANLDPALRSAVLQEIVQLKENLDITILYVTHNREECLTAGDYAAFLSQGTLQQVGTPYSLYSRPVSLEVAQFFDETYPLSPQDLPQGIPVPTNHYVATRPHLVKIRPSPEVRNDEILFPGTILRSEFQGSFSRAVVQLPSGATIQVMDYTHCTKECSDFNALHLVIKPQDFVFLPLT